MSDRLTIEQRHNNTFLKSPRNKSAPWINAVAKLTEGCD